MVNIIIKPATGTESGTAVATGHAGKAPDMVCAAVTTLMEALAANLDNCWDVKVTRRWEPGHMELRWTKTDRQGNGLRRANDAAGFTYTALRALSGAYPEAVRVTREKPGFRRE